MQIMSVRRMRADVDLYTGYHELRAREQYFASLVMALTEIDKAYEICLGKLSPAIQKRSGSVQALSDRAKELNTRVEAFASSSGQSRDGRAREASTGSDPTRGGGKTHAVIGLAVGTERLSYAQTVLEEKVREVADFQRTLLSKVGGSELVLRRHSDKSIDFSASSNNVTRSASDSTDPPGNIVKGLMGLEESAAGRGTRKLLEVIGLWGNWLDYLKRRVQSYF